MNGSRVKLSAIDAMQQALEHTRRMLFPFQFDRWIVLGLLAFLDQCGRGGGPNFPNIPSNLGDRSGGGGGGETESSLRLLNSIGSVFDPGKLGASVGVIVGVVIAVMVLVVLLMAFVTWLSSRGCFMYIDAVATGRAEVGRPWREHRERAFSLFAWRFGLGMLGLVVILVIAGLGVGLGLGASAGHLSAAVAWSVGLLLVLPLFLIVVIGLAVLNVLLRDFVAPVQWRQELACGDALRLVLGEARGQIGAFLVYFLLKIAMAIAFAIIGLVACGLTCCCVLLPVIGQTILQPLHFFERSFSLFFLRQLGYDLFPAPAAAPALEP